MESADKFWTADQPTDGEYRRLLRAADAARGWPGDAEYSGPVIAVNEATTVLEDAPVSRRRAFTVGFAWGVGAGVVVASLVDYAMHAGVL